MEKGEEKKRKEKHVSPRQQVCCTVQQQPTNNKQQTTNTIKLNSTQKYKISNQLTFGSACITSLKKSSKY